MAIRTLPRVVPAGDRSAQDRTKHPMRLVTEEVADDAERWTRSRAGEVQSLFDELAGDWNQRFVADPLRSAPLADALTRGELARFGTCLDLGSGTGLEAPLLATRFERVVAADLSAAMLRQAAVAPPRVQTDAARLPFADGTFDAVVLVNAFLFADEVARVLAAHGTVVWVSSVGADTPIYLSTEAVVTALGTGWSAVESAAGDGTWAAVRRDDAGAAFNG